eukprot:363670-Chlamydomonas_euryale.AAC.16
MRRCMCLRARTSQLVRSCWWHMCPRPRRANCGDSICSTDMASGVSVLAVWPANDQDILLPQRAWQAAWQAAWQGLRAEFV